MDYSIRELPECTACGGNREVSFSGKNTRDEFGQWLFQRKHKNYTARSHNGSGFDNNFLLQYLIKQSVVPTIIYNGSRIVYMLVKRSLNIRIIDTLKFLPMRLADVPTTFGFAEIKKGYFPHKFNKSENMNYVGPYPEREMYGYDEMKECERTKFLAWYDLRKEETFDFMKEIYEYCKSDVDILQQACAKFRRLILQLTECSIPTASLNAFVTQTGNKKSAIGTNTATLSQQSEEDNDTVTLDGEAHNSTDDLSIVAVDPFQYVTIASVCMAIYKFKFLRERCTVKIGGKLVNATRQGVSYFMTSGQFLCYLGEAECRFESTDIAQVSNECTHSTDSIIWMEMLKVPGIRHVQNNDGREVTLPNGKGGYYRLDGYDAATKTVYEYNGCLWHGCPKCFGKKGRYETTHPHTRQPMSELYRQTKEKEEYLISRGINVVSKWEHDFRDEVKKNPQLRQEYDDILDRIKTRLDPRDAFYGGRTDVMCTDYSVEDDEKINYVDFTSLYPYVNKYCLYPIGLPEKIRSGNINKTDIGMYFGVAKVDILPPRGLFIPVLPYRVSKKLLFTLCHTCSSTTGEAHRSQCRCSDDMRKLHGTWTTVELQRAVEKGYVIKHIYEIYHWKEKARLFTDYVNTFLKYKQEASGWPDWIQNEANKKQYLANYLRHEGIELNEDDIRHNPGLRCVCKLMLNSFWGKFGQRQNKPQSKVVNKPEDLLRLLSSQKFVINDFHILSPDLLMVNHEYEQDFTPVDTTTNVYIASFTTAYARLKLYDVLEQLKERALYCDTDSVIYVSKGSDTHPTIGDYLGELTNELDGDDYITEFVSAGPKLYAFKTFKGHTVCKVRGFTLNYQASKSLNFDTIRHDILKGDVVDVRCFNILRDKHRVSVYNKISNKKCKKVLDKRRLRSNCFTYPFGY